MINPLKFIQSVKQEAFRVTWPTRKDVMVGSLMVFALGYTQHQSQGMSLAVLAVPVTFLAAYTYHKTGENPINFKYALIIAVCFVAGAYFGTKIAVSINENVLKKLFSLLLLFIAIKMFFSK